MTFVLDPPPIANSPVSRLDPRWKLSALVVAAAAAAASQTLGPAMGAFTVALLLAVVAQLPGRWFLGRLGALTVALVPFAVIMPLVDGFAGLRMAGLLGAKAGAVVTFALVGLGTTPIPVTLHAARAMRLPGTLVHVLLLSYHYLFLLADEVDRLRRAIRVRGFRARMNRHSYRTVGHVIGTLVVRGAERAEGVAVAMRCRGFDGRFRSLAEFRTSVADVVFFVVIVGMAIGIVVWDFA
jgi:cobalt/nickel transport system permease protein